MIPLEAMSASNLKVSYESMGDFRKQVQSALDTLRNSKGAPQVVADQTVEQHALHSGSSFAEAEGLTAHYTAVQQTLTQMADLVDRLLDALEIAMRGAESGYQNLDEDERRRFHTVNTEVYDRREQARSEDPAQPAARPADNSDKGAF
ncbi:hypothetical protein SRB5_63720 [Streptomyces sp. RB5]|uniref:Uncharacterized protein n=1 Tax=Streptomyces smaragdinus TaxID=2585196 RepID=A0A7K0CRQ8_9ACTN|nr:hypothetical protein [Streptomyces smaragdinus]MQY16176.1 hypothetical protein [Streptomyces smaragdinus]